MFHSDRSVVKENFVPYKDPVDKNDAWRSWYHRNKSDSKFRKNRAAYQKKRRHKDMDKARRLAREAAAKRREVDLEGELLLAARDRAKRKSIPCTITRADIPIPETCPVLGIPLYAGKGRHHAGSPTLDRRDNTKGYTPENTRVISYRANSLKSNATANELRAVLAYVEDTDDSF